MEELFKKNNIKFTSQRKLVLETVNELEYLATAKNIVLKCSSKVDRSTVYRIIDLFIEKNIFEKKLNYDNEVYYSVKEEHGHYFNCIKCHKKEKIDDCPLKLIDDNLEKEKGYKVLNHIVEIDGICKECQKSK